MINSTALEAHSSSSSSPLTPSGAIQHKLQSYQRRGRDLCSSHTTVHVVTHSLQVPFDDAASPSPLVPSHIPARPSVQYSNTRHGTHENKSTTNDGTREGSTRHTVREARSGNTYTHLPPNLNIFDTHQSRLILFRRHDCTRMGNTSLVTLA